MGRNGAGKSTLLRLAKALIEPTRGRVGTAGAVALLLQNPGDYLIHEQAVDEAGPRLWRPPARGSRAGQPARSLRRRARAAGAGGGACRPAARRGAA